MKLSFSRTRRSEGTPVSPMAWSMQATHWSRSLMPFAIGIKERDQWVACMDQAMGETEVDPALRARLKQSFFQTADFMRNKGI